MRYERAKVDRIHSMMQASGLDYIVCKNSENVLYFSGYWPIRGWSFSVVSAQGDPVLLAPDYEEEFAEAAWAPEKRIYRGDPYDALSSLLRELGVSGTVGYEGSFETIAGNAIGVENAHAGFQHLSALTRSLPSAKLVDASNTILELRKVKTPEEIAAMRRAADLCSIGLEAAYEKVREGSRETEIAAACEKRIYEEGFGFSGVGKVARAFAFVMSGPNSLRAPRPYNISSERRVRKGDAVLIELNTCLDGYWCDLTRTWVVGSPSQEQSDVWQILLDAQSHAVDAVRDGVESELVYQAARKVIVDAGYGNFYPHGLGHGIGVACHEPPSIGPGSKEKLYENYLHSAEPGIYKKGVGGMRIEDIVLDHKTGGERISTFHREL